MTTATQFVDLQYTRTAQVHRTQARIALLIMIAIPVLCIALNQAGSLRFVFPPLCVLVGAVLLQRSKPLYVGLVFWLWFLTPFLRRMSDFQGGWTPASPVLLAPYITTGISGLSLLPSIRNFWSRRYLPYVSTFVAILYGLTIGLARYPLFNVLRAFLNWVVPVIFGAFILENRHLYVEFRKVIEKCFLYGVLLTGAYGIFQFFTLPEWDKTWMLNVQMNSLGAILPMKIRVFSTMNALSVFGAVTACGLLLLFNVRPKLRLLSAVCGSLGLFLTMSRSSWLNFLGGAAFLVIQGRGQRARLAAAVLPCIVFLGALTLIPDVNDLAWGRIQTLSDPSHDASFTARIEGHETALQEIAQEPFGEGVGSTDTDHSTEGDDDVIGPHDSTALELFYSLGWIGSLIYLVGIGALGIQLWRKCSNDPFILASKAIIVGFLAQSLLASVMLGILGFMVWTFASMCLAEQWVAEAATDDVEQIENETVDFAAA
jgi:hypothetical protein